MPVPDLRVAFDMDGTVADMHVVLRREAERLFGPTTSATGPAAEPPQKSRSTGSDVPAVVAADDLHLNRQQLRDLWAHVERTENFWTTLPETEEGIVAHIAATAQARRWMVLFITTRPSTAGEPTQLQTQRWLRAHGFEFPSVCVLERSRGKLADVLQLDAIVDDRPENCLSIAADSKAKALLLRPEPEDTMPLGLGRLGVRAVPTIRAAVDWLEAYDDSRRQSAVVRSVRRLFGRGID